MVPECRMTDGFVNRLLSILLELNDFNNDILFFTECCDQRCYEATSLVYVVFYYYPLPLKGISYFKKK